MDNRDGTYVKSDDGDRAVPEKDISSPIHQPEEDSPLLGGTFLLGHGMNPRLAEAPPPGDTRVPIAPSGPSPGAAKKNNREVTAGQHATTLNPFFKKPHLLGAHGAKEFDGDVVFMRDTSYFFYENSGQALVDVVRLGDCRSEVTVHYRTVGEADLEGNGDADFVTADTTAVFAPGETVATCAVALADDSFWEPMESFAVEIYRVTTAAGPHAAARLGAPYLRSEVHIVDDDEYPRNGAGAGGATLLIWGFLRERWRHNFPRSLTALCYGCYDTLHSLVRATVPLVIIDEILTPRVMNWPLLLTAAGAWVGSAALDLLCKWQYVEHMGRAGARRDLRNWLVRKFVWISESVHQQLRHSTFLDATVTSVDTVAGQCLVGCYTLITGVVDLAVQLVFALLIDWHAVLPLAMVFPFIMLVIWCSQSALLQLPVIQQQAEDRWLEKLNETLENWRLTCTYNLREQRAELIEGLYQDFHSKEHAVWVALFRAQSAIRLANDVAVGLVIIFGAREVVDGRLSAGRFVALITVFSHMGGVLISLSDAVLAMQQSANCVHHIAKLLNLPIGITGEIVSQDEERQRSQRRSGSIAQSAAQGRRKESTENLSVSPSMHRGCQFGAYAGVDDAHADRMTGTLSKGDLRTVDFVAAWLALRGSSADTKAAFRAALHGASGARTQATIDRFCGAWEPGRLVGLLSIALQDVTFEFGTGSCDSDGQESGVQVQTLRGLTCDLPLGFIVALSAATPAGGQGILTLMKIITRNLFKTGGSVMVPEHMSTLLVFNEPLFFDTSLWQNLVLGCTAAEQRAAPGGDFDRHVWALCAELGLSSHLMGHREMAVGSDGFNMRMADRKVVCFVRAMLAKPDVMVLCKPMGMFGRQRCGRLFNMLEQWRTRTGPFEEAVPSSRTAHARQGRTAHEWILAAARYSSASAISTRRSRASATLWPRSQPTRTAMRSAR